MPILYMYSSLDIGSIVVEGGEEILKAQRMIVVRTEHGRGNGMAKHGLGVLVRVLAAAMIAALCSCHQESAHAPPAAPPPPVKAADVNAERLAAGGPEQWATPGPERHGTYYSPFKNINARKSREPGL